MDTKSLPDDESGKQLTEAEALRPPVPVVTYKTETDKEKSPQIEKMQNVYKALTIKLSNGTVTITANATRDFPAWRAAIGDVSFGGNAWRVQTKSLCAGRECKGQPLQASLSVQQLDISVPVEKVKKNN